ncbi:MAG: hypothetical protein A2557_05260 [Candidatus Lambdaproteobacteria bacterium RIFOXYD2_FULL_56_26]|uniref:SGNH hydrolase-type esterase domain-containing protein n=1 Tax=Candidatus Lambdaproteobacteria bacterium RIFOXYD2_FULL_56_26 TaxID=1817773 RepID=A0A1F6GVF9_9PROT|nr:MAG: hypothetical protein A2557_05260 [Candidatus Lambdaproteobacteria bacterium RIFOXYD2_FULL_56_26]OGH03261.1 MAG: hypothetical protein A2426_06830 [Candidatus Lambdaproteobacteria bacterium RIFOXYC1_FULL_56_13]
MVASFFAVPLLIFAVDPQGENVLLRKMKRLTDWPYVGQTVNALTQMWIDRSDRVSLSQSIEPSKTGKIFQATMLNQEQAHKKVAALVSVLDPYSGYRYAPQQIYEGKCEHEKQKDIKTIIKTDSHGFRSDNIGPKVNGTIRIAMVSGSAGHSGCENETTIIGYLSEIMNKDGKKVEFINASHVGYISKQELAVFVEELLDMNIDLLVAYDGYNDLDNYTSAVPVIGWPGLYWSAVHNPRKLPLDDLEHPNPKYASTPAEEIVQVRDFYLSNVEKMAKIAHAYNIKFLGVLQPAKNKQRAQKETCKKELAISARCDMHEFYYYSVEDRFEKWDRQQHASGRYLSLLDFVQDESIFLDVVHLPDSENKIVAEEIYRFIKAEQML